MATSGKTLKNISEIRRYFHRNEEPVYLVFAVNEPGEGVASLSTAPEAVGEGER